MGERGSRISLFVGIALTIAVGPAVAEEEQAHETHGWHRHHVGLYGGGAYRGKHHEKGQVLEGEYEYRFRRQLGLGVVAERTFSVEGDPWLFVFPLTLHPVGGLRLGTGPGIEFEDGESGNFVWRLGLGWDFELGRGFFLTPAANADLVEGDWNFTYGIQLGYGF